MFSLLTIVCCLLAQTFALNQTGELTNSKYPIGMYYGSRYQEFFLIGSLTQDNLTEVRFSIFHDTQIDGSIIFPDTNAHTVYKSFLLDGVPFKTVVAGSLNVSGYLDGENERVLFNNPTGVIVFKLSIEEIYKERNKEIYILSENANESCKKDIENGIIKKECINMNIWEEATIDQIVVYYDMTNFENFTKDYSIEQEYAVVSDTKNHCIRLINLTEWRTYTIGGMCTEPGFKDGPLMYSRFNSPGRIGIDIEGNIYVQDIGNRYLRLIKIDWINFDFRKIWVYTILQGACVTIDLQKYERYLYCYRNWKKTSGEPLEHIFDSTLLGVICESDSENCT